jgi:putative CocE/NonD family hydrolase
MLNRIGAVMLAPVAAFVFAFTPLTPLQAQPAPAAASYDVKANYTKYEFRVPMRDGVKLFTSVYVPKDSSKTWPFLMVRTPYSVAPYGTDFYKKTLGPTEDFDKAGFIYVFQDVRGRYMSEGTWLEMTPHKPGKASAKDIDESSDTYDTVEWLLKNIPNNNGKVGMWGISYPGFYVSAGIIDSHPAIKAASPQAPVTDMFMGDDSYHGGAFMLASNFGFYSAFKQQKNPTVQPKKWDRFEYETEDAYQFFLKHGTIANLDKLLAGPEHFAWKNGIDNDVYNDYWKSRNISAHMKGVKAAVLTVGGWFDLEDPMGPFLTYRAIKKYNSGAYNGIVMGPWVHGGWARTEGAHLGMVDFAMKNSEFFMKKIQLPFFEQYLKSSGDAKLPEAYVFETGTNVWRQFPQWPPKQVQAKTLYFREGGALSFDAPRNDKTSFDEYVSDPAKPVPFIAYTAPNVPQEYVVGDQRFASTRPDVLTYQTEPLEEDVTIAGPISPRLFVSTTGTDSDWVVKLIDVYPPEWEEDGAGAGTAERPKDVPPPKIRKAGYQQLVRGEPLRGKFRNGMEKPEAMIPGAVTAINFDIPDMLHNFRRGHRIMVQLQSSWFPLIDRNPQVFMRIPDAKPEDFKAVTQRVYRAPSQASGVLLQIMPSPANNIK